MCLGLSAVRNETHLFPGLHRLLGKGGSDYIRRLVRERGITIPLRSPNLPSASERRHGMQGDQWAHHWMTLCKQEILLRFPNVPDFDRRET